MILHSNLCKDPREALLHKPMLGITKWECVLVPHFFVTTKQAISIIENDALLFKEVKRRVHVWLVIRNLGRYSQAHKTSCKHIWKPCLDQFPLMQSPTFCGNAIPSFVLQCLKVWSPGYMQQPSMLLCFLGFFIVLFSIRGSAVGVLPLFYFALPPGNPSTLRSEWNLCCVFFAALAI